MALLEQSVVDEAMRRLIARTSEGRQSWALLGNSDDSFFSHTEKFSYSIESRDGDGSAPFHFEIYRMVPKTDGVPGPAILVGELWTVPTRGSGPTATRNRDLERLYAGAKTASLGISGLPEDLLSELD